MWRSRSRPKPVGPLPACGHPLHSMERGWGRGRAVTFPPCGLPAGRHGHALHSLERGRGEAAP